MRIIGIWEQHDSNKQQQQQEQKIMNQHTKKKTTHKKKIMKNKSQLGNSANKRIVLRWSIILWTTLFFFLFSLLFFSANLSLLTFRRSFYGISHGMPLVCEYYIQMVPGSVRSWIFHWKMIISFSLSHVYVHCRRSSDRVVIMTGFIWFN